MSEPLITRPKDPDHILWLKIKKGDYEMRLERRKTEITQECKKKNKPLPEDIDHVVDDGIAYFIYAISLLSVLLDKQHIMMQDFSNLTNDPRLTEQKVLGQRQLTAQQAFANVQDFVRDCSIIKITIRQNRLQQLLKQYPYETL